MGMFVLGESRVIGSNPYYHPSITFRIPTHGVHVQLFDLSYDKKKVPRRQIKVSLFVIKVRYPSSSKRRFPSSMFRREAKHS